MKIHYGWLVKEIDQVLAEIAERTPLTSEQDAEFKGEAKAHRQTRAWLLRCWNSVCADPNGYIDHLFNEDGICLKCSITRELADQSPKRL